MHAPTPSARVFQPPSVPHLQALDVDGAERGGPLVLLAAQRGGTAAGRVWQGRERASQSSRLPQIRADAGPTPTAGRNQAPGAGSATSQSPECALSAARQERFPCSASIKEGLGAQVPAGPGATDGPAKQILPAGRTSHPPPAPTHPPITTPVHPKHAHTLTSGAAACSPGKHPARWGTRCRSHTWCNRRSRLQGVVWLWWWGEGANMLWTDRRVQEWHARWFGWSCVPYGGAGLTLAAAPTQHPPGRAHSLPSSNSH